LKKIKKTGAPLSTDRVWMIAQLEANQLKQEEETGNEAKSIQQKNDKNEAKKENLVNQNRLHNYPLYPKDE
jgi:hypothetical protein